MGPDLVAALCSLWLVSHAGQTPATATPPAAPPAPPVLFGATLEGYYGWNANRPPDGTNAFRAYDVKTDSFAIQQAAVVIDAPPSVADGRRYGLRVDLQFGEAAGALQCNPTNEPRPSPYCNLWQVYGTYVLPVGKGLTMDFGKFAHWGSRPTTRRTTTTSRAHCSTISCPSITRARGSRIR